MSVKGTQTTADFINFDTATKNAFDLINSDKQKLIGLYIIISINLGLRVSDVLKLNWEQLQDKEELTIIEGKTGKRRNLAINNNIKKALAKFPNTSKGLMFVSQKNTVYKIQSINAILKEVFIKEKGLAISTHSCRKSFGRRMWNNNNQSDTALIYLSELFNHKNIAVTRKYLGISKEELNNIYLSL
ncbi:tyrosine-type recombinase/integrase [Flavobacterium sp. LB1P71]|uniref:tyrosine-type recombinase/integrase n=1 Tax=Flavobacterium sp. LB1P71 TaxID=3401716 RepID=UPI003AB08020